MRQGAQMFEWASLQWQSVNEGDPLIVERATRTLTNALDAYRYFGIRGEDLVPHAVAEWYTLQRR